ncbi:MAG TPA: sulfatase-like hydrolase/transferase [Terriglobia bacterium]|nr:sulfatase-like hydrolase/transferase [Terriglobia bacterium]
MGDQGNDSSTQRGWKQRSLLGIGACAWIAGMVVGLYPLRAAPAVQIERPTPVILVSIDTLRADHLSAYGYRRIRTSEIDRFTRGGTIFTQANAQIPLTLPSHTSLLTSTFPFENQIEENGERLPLGVATLAAVLRSHGYKTAAFIGSDFLSRRYGLDQGFDVYDSPFNLLGRGLENPMAVRGRRDGALVLRAAKEWLGATRGQLVFAFVHLFDMHTPYELPPSFVPSRGISRYDAELEYVDRLIGQFRRALKQGGWWDRSLVILLSDHGEGLGEHGESTHGYFIYQSTLWVPLIFHWPAGTPSFPLQVSQPVGLIDVAPTVLDFLGLPLPPTFQGKSLLSLLKSRNGGERRLVYSESLYAHDAFRWAPLRSLRVGHYKYIEAPKPELYDLERDPGERSNAARLNKAEALALRRDLASLLARSAQKWPTPPRDMSPETLALLDSLGYVSRDSRSELTGGEKDPKDGLAEYHQYEKGLVSLYGGRADAAVSTFRAILARDPRNTLARFHLGESYLMAHRPSGALREWRRALVLDPEYAPAAQALGEYWLERHNYSKARSCFLQALAIDPENYTIQLNLGIAEEHLGLFKEAHEHIEAACKIAPTTALCQPVREQSERSLK